MAKLALACAPTNLCWYAGTWPVPLVPSSDITCRMWHVCEAGVWWWHWWNCSAGLRDMNQLISSATFGIAAPTNPPWACPCGRSGPREVLLLYVCCMFAYAWPRAVGPFHFCPCCMPHLSRSVASHPYACAHSLACHLPFHTPHRHFPLLRSVVAIAS